MQPPLPCTKRPTCYHGLPRSLQRLQSRKARHQRCWAAGRAALTAHKQHRQHRTWVTLQSPDKHRSSVILAAAGTQAQAQALSTLELVPLLNADGLIQPVVPKGSQAAVFAIYNEGKQLQYVGFSRDLYNSLRTVFSRRPDKTYFYKYVNLPELDQQEMIGIRAAWFDECGGPPPGNKLALERTAWQQPVSAGAISDRGKQKAAEETLRQLIVLIQSRGCKEDFQANPALLTDGQVDFMPAQALSPEEIEQQRARLAEQAKLKRTVQFELNGEQAAYELLFTMSFKTNGGMMFDISLTFESKETKHRVIVGKEYYEEFGLEPEAMIVMVMTFLLQQRVPRHTEGMLLSSQFPINYFSVSEVEQSFDGFAAMYEQEGRTLQGNGKFWRFNKVHSYGASDEDSKAFAKAFQVIEPAAT